tara:strand:+ start:639 stop:1169 length:531 start_codon:yes stop_codon:yes gene_type:complete
MKKQNLNLFSLLIIFFLSFTNLANSEEKFINFSKKLVIVTDGDTIKIGNEKIRLFGIDAPEMKQICKDKNNDPYACGYSSKTYLKDLINHPGYGDQIYCYYSERDRYKRIIGECFVGADAESKININYLMVLRGQSVAYIRYSEKYLEAQNQAKKDKVGIWGGTFDLPEEWRKKNK